ncbi:MAG TPA: DUF4870 domain-containing protein [Ktedonobacterales bacterium]
MNTQNTPSSSGGQVPGSSGGIPPAGAATPSTPSPPGGASAQSPKNETAIAGIAHLSSLFAPIIGPLIIWLTSRDSMPYAARQAKQALFFHIVMGVLGVVAVLVLVGRWVSSVFAIASQAVTSNTVPSTPTLPAWLFAFFTLIIILGLTGQALSIYGAVQAFQGKDFSYPLLGWL